MNAKAFLNRTGNLQLLLLPILSVCVIFVPLALLRPIVTKYMGLQLLLNMAIPLGIVTMGQMFAMAIGEIDFSIGNLVSLVTCIIGTVLPSNLYLGIAMLLGIVLVYMVIGAFLYLRKLSSIVVTIGMSFVWTGLAVTIQPSPGGKIPAVLQTLVSLSPPLVPLPVIFLIGLAIINNLAYQSDGPRYQWWLWVAFGWGIGVVSHFLSAFLYQSGSLVEKMAKRELEKMNESDKT